MSPEDRLVVLEVMNPEQRAAALEAMSPEEKVGCIAALPPTQRMEAIAAYKVSRRIKSCGHILSLILLCCVRRRIRRRSGRKSGSRTRKSSHPKRESHTLRVTVARISIDADTIHSIQGTGV